MMSTGIDKKSFVNNHANAIVDHHLKSYEKDPYFVKKAEKASTFLKDIGLPKPKKK